MRTVFIYCEQNCKPGSVFDSHLSRRAVASALKPPRERPGQPICSHTGVAPDRVYSDGQFPAVGCALTAPFHPYRQSCALTVRVENDSCGIVSAAAGFIEIERRGSAPLSHFSPVSHGPLARMPWDSRPYQHSAAVAAVYLCCTFPEVAFGGRYPLSLPCGARTFLMDGLSACPRDCLFSSRFPFYRKIQEKSISFRKDVHLCVCTLRKDKVSRRVLR